MLSGMGGVEGQGDADDAGLAGAGADQFEFSVMGFDDFAADREAKPQANIAGSEERSRRFLRGLGGEAFAVVLNFDLEAVAAIRDRFGDEADPDSRVAG